MRAEALCEPANWADRARPGENGNGKTTLVKLMLGQLEPTEGEVTTATAQCAILQRGARLYINRIESKPSCNTQFQGPKKNQFCHVFS